MSPRKFCSGSLTRVLCLSACLTLMGCSKPHVLVDWVKNWLGLSSNRGSVLFPSPTVAAPPSPTAAAPPSPTAGGAPCGAPYHCGSPPNCTDPMGHVIQIIGVCWNCDSNNNYPCTSNKYREVCTTSFDVAAKMSVDCPMPYKVSHVTCKEQCDTLRW
jgi:hypothetical protein